MIKFKAQNEITDVIALQIMILQGLIVIRFYSDFQVEGAVKPKEKCKEGVFTTFKPMGVSSLFMP